MTIMDDLIEAGDKIDKRVAEIELHVGRNIDRLDEINRIYGTDVSKYPYKICIQLRKLDMESSQLFEEVKMLREKAKYDANFYDIESEINEML